MTKQKVTRESRRRFLGLARYLAIGGVGVAIGSIIGYNWPRELGQPIEEPDELLVGNFDNAKKKKTAEGVDIIESNGRIWEVFALKSVEGGYPRHSILPFENNPNNKAMGLDASRGSIIYVQTPLTIGNYSTLSYQFNATRDPAYVRLYFNGELLRGSQPTVGIFEYDISQYKNRHGILRIQVQGINERDTNSIVQINDVKLRKTPHYSRPKA